MEFVCRVMMFTDLECVRIELKPAAVSRSNNQASRCQQFKEKDMVW